MTQIILDPFGVSFLFVDHRFQTTLTCEHAFEFVDSKGRTDSYRPSEKTGTFGPILFHALLNEPVVGIDLSADGLRLTFTFESGLQLAILSELGGYESGTIACGGGSEQFWVF